MMHYQPGRLFVIGKFTVQIKSHTAPQETDSPLALQIVVLTEIFQLTSSALLF